MKTDLDDRTVTFRLPGGGRWQHIEYPTSALAAEGMLALRKAGCQGYIGREHRRLESPKQPEPAA